MELLEKRALKEVDKILIHAQTKHLENLKDNFHNFDPNRVDTCVYGLMTGNCNNQDAIHLIEACCRKGIYLSEDYKSYRKGLRKGLNVDRAVYWMSDLEQFIFIRQGFDSAEDYDKALKEKADWVQKHLIDKI